MRIAAQYELNKVYYLIMWVKTFGSLFIFEPTTITIVMRKPCSKIML